VYAKLLRHARETKTGKLFPISTRMLRKIWAKVRPANGKGVHSLRHTVGVDYYKESRDVHGTGGVLGHKSLKNTMIYLTFVESREQRTDVFKKIWKAA
jgi:integrase